MLIPKCEVSEEYQQEIDELLAFETECVSVHANLTEVDEMAQNQSIWAEFRSRRGYVIRSHQEHAEGCPLCLEDGDKSEQ